MKQIFVALGAILALALGLTPASAQAADQSENVKLIASFSYAGVDPSDRFFTAGTDIAFSGKYVYAMQQGNEGGIHIFDASKPVPKVVNFFSCPGEQNDVAVVKPGLLAIGYHRSQCGFPGAGVRLIDVRNPKKPKILGNVDLPGGTHTLTAYPGKTLVYASPNGLTGGGGAGAEQIIDVSDPTKPKVAATYDPPHRQGCHDLTFSITKERALAVCPSMLGQTSILDVSDPLAPVLLGVIVNPLISLHHSAAVTDDGNLLILGDEHLADECVGGPTGALYAYDLTNPSFPIPLGYFGTTHGSQPFGSPELDRDTWCSAHIFNFVPGTNTLVSSWYAGGMNVIDWTNPSTPEEIAYYRADTEEGATNYWSAYWYDGRIWANDRGRGGLDVFTVEGLEEGK